MNDLILEFKKEWNRKRQTESSISNVLINHYIETSDRRCCYLFEIKHLLDVATPIECFFIEVEDKYKSILCDWYVQWNNGDGKNLDDYLLESNSDIATDLYSYLYEELTGDYYDYGIDDFYAKNRITKCCSFSGDSKNYSLTPAYSYLCTFLINNTNGDLAKIHDNFIIEDSLCKELLETCIRFSDCKDLLLYDELYGRVYDELADQVSSELLGISFSVVFTDIINIAKSILSQRHADLLAGKFPKSDIDSYFETYGYKEDKIVLYSSAETEFDEVVLHKTVHKYHDHYFESYIMKTWMCEETREVLEDIYFIDRKVERFFEDKKTDVFTEISRRFKGADAFENAVSWLKIQYQESVKSLHRKSGCF